MNIIYNTNYNIRRCHLWRPRAARASSARGSSSSDAASTWSASCAPTATPTPRSTTATTSCDDHHHRHHTHHHHTHHQPQPQAQALYNIVRGFNAQCAMIANISTDFNSKPVVRPSDHTFLSLRDNMDPVVCKKAFDYKRDLSLDDGHSYSDMRLRRVVPNQNVQTCHETREMSWNHANLLAYQKCIGNPQVMASSSSLALTANTSRTDSRKSYMSDIGNVSHCKFEGNVYKRNEPHGSSWSLSNLGARNAIHNEAQYPHYENVRRKSEDNIRKQHVVPSNSKISLVDSAICTQPRESHTSIHNKNDETNNSVVHWTNSVENRVCCPETVLYGAVYGLKCLK